MFILSNMFKVSVHVEKHPHPLVVLLIFSVKPQEFNDRLEKRHEAKKEAVGHSKQAEFVRLMEEEVRRDTHTHTHIQDEEDERRRSSSTSVSSALWVNLWLVCSRRNETRCQPAMERQEDSRRTR